MTCGCQKNEDIFSMNAHHCEGLEIGFFHIGMPATTGTYGQSLENTVNVLVEKISPEKILSDSPATEVQAWQRAILYLEIK